MTDAERLAALEQEIRDINRTLTVLLENLARVASVIKTEQVQEQINAGILKEMDLLKANFKPQHEVAKEEEKVDPKADFRKKAIESVGGSMVFTERQEIYWDGK